MNAPGIIDCHVHFSAPSRYADFLRFLEAIGIERAGIVSLPDRRRVNFNPEALEAKLEAPERFFVFGGFDYTGWFFPGLASAAATLGDQVDRMADLGMDGIKMWAGKPTFQAQLGVGLDDPVFDGAYAAAARHGLPILLHVADPLPFWSSDRGSFGWPAPGDAAPPPSFEHLQAQAGAILERHRRTVFIFPHLLFRAGNLREFSRFMRDNENAYLDLSPGLYFFGDLHRQREEAGRFFEEFKARVLFGTDAMWFDEGHPYLPALDVDQNVLAARRLLDFLRTGRSIENPFALTRAELPRLDGLALPDAVLAPILRENFVRLFGERPRALERLAVRDYTAEIEARRRAISDREDEP